MVKSLLFQSILLLILTISCQKESKDQHKIDPYLKSLKTINLKLKEINLRTYLAITDFEQTKGLSSIKPDFFTDNEAMLFFNSQDQTRSFWMPDTYFNLDIFFLDKELKVLYLERNVPFHPGRSESTKPIYRTGQYYCRHVLELKSSQLSGKIKIGDQLLLDAQSQRVLNEIKSSARL